MLNKEQAEQVLRGDTQNIVRKVSEGKPLTPNERRFIADYAGANQTAKTIVELSNLLGVSRQSIYNWQKSSDAPQNLNITEWIGYIETKESTQTQGGGRVAVGGRHWSAQEIIDLKALETQERHRRQIAERKLKEIELKKIEEDWVPISDAKQIIARVTSTMSRLLENFPRRYANQIDPANAEKVEADLRVCINEMLTQLQMEVE
jgi:DNA-directed RNA polymerase specialized sigma subunit